MLTEAEIDAFVRDGFVQVPGAVPSEIVQACVDDIAERLAELRISLTERASWAKPVVRIACPETPAFAAAGTTRVLHEAYDQLVGEGRWWKREGVGGTIPVRFPRADDPGDTGWHIESSYEVDGAWRANVRSRGRGLLAIFLLSDVGPDDAPTRIRAGSHRDAAKVLAAAGEDGYDGSTSAPLVKTASSGRQVVYATGNAGDVYLCHPFLVHAASWPHRGTRPRIIAQPGIATLEPFTLEGGDECCPVERAILEGLDARNAPRLSG